MKFKLTIIFSVLFLSVFAQDSEGFQGIYMIYENISYNTTFRQKVPSIGFDERYDAEINTYPNIKLGYSLTGIIESNDVAAWGVDLGFGLNYGRSVVNAIAKDQSYVTHIDFKALEKNNQTFFEYFQPGNQGIIDDYGLNLHFDAGTILYVGAEIDAGVSHLSFTDSRVSSQKVNSTGWYSNARFQIGISIPLPFVIDAGFILNLKAYGVVYGWSARTYTMDWISDDKELKNFSTIQSNGTPVGGGFSLSILLD
jgi:hypothetical protein